MPTYRATGNLVIRPCASCRALVLHEEGVLAAGEVPAPAAMRERWRAFPHRAPGGASCFAGGTLHQPSNKTVARAAVAARRVRARQEKRQQGESMWGGDPGDRR